ncbi:MAG TPA: hemerythrin domain-containing protein [Vicinamibacterales bacterium]|jgi:hemerythrin-like domain-containing protein
MFIKIGQRPDHGFDQPLGLLSDCHRRIEYFLDVLIRIAERSGSALTASERTDLQGALDYFATAAPRHTADEEQSLFPRLRRSADPAAQAALATLARLESDHTEADTHHRAVDALVRGWLAGGTLDSAAAAELRGRLQALRAIYTAHIATEDRELFPAAARILSAGDQQAIGQEMASRRAVNTAS